MTALHALKLGLIYWAAIIFVLTVAWWWFKYDNRIFD
jgi:hypothetical protein